MLGHGYLAVDLFFLLSGFVIAYTYEARLQNGWSLGRFAAARAIRLYPLVIGAVLSIVLLRCIYPHPALPSAELLSQATLNALLIPNLTASAPDQFPIIGPSWSLFYELIVNIAYAALLPLIGRKALYFIVITSGIVFVYYTYRDGAVALLHHSFIAGLARTIFSFSVGVALFRNIRIITGTGWSAPEWLFYAATIGILFIPIPETGNWLFEILCIFAIFPLITTGAIRCSSARSGDRISNLLGELSYPIYVLHMPVSAYVGVGLGWAISGTRLASATAVLTVIVAFVAWRAFDRPIRHWLNGRLGQRQPRPMLRAEP